MVLRPLELACGWNVEKFGTDCCKPRLRDHSRGDLEDNNAKRNVDSKAWLKVFKSGRHTLSGTGLEFILVRL